jgi:hypothetical protein
VSVSIGLQPKSLSRLVGLLYSRVQLIDRLYVPDEHRLLDFEEWFGYLVRHTSGKMLVLEVKGQDNQEQQTKREFLSEWCREVNGHGGFGVWENDVSRNPNDVYEILARHDKLDH